MPVTLGLSENLVGPRIKTRPEDFVVEEVPLYSTSGEGEHLFIKIKKNNLDNRRLRARVRQALEISDAEIGQAGIKDKVAVATQWLSVPRRCEELLHEIEGEDLSIEDQQTHNQKLRMGHLKGNKFKILVRVSETINEANFYTRCEELAEQGMPNYFGQQRFGKDADNTTSGRLLVMGEGDRKLKRLPKRTKQFLISAWQSDLFNKYLEYRIEHGRLRSPMPGDIFHVVASSGLFANRGQDGIEDDFANKEIIPTGPIFGSKMRWAEGEMLGYEEKILESDGITEDQLTSLGKMAPGSRRPVLLYPKDLTCSFCQEGVWLSFKLTKGAYATEVVNHLFRSMKS